MGRWWSGPTGHRGATQGFLLSGPGSGSFSLQGGVVASPVHPVPAKGNRPAAPMVSAPAIAGARDTSSAGPANAVGTLELPPIRRARGSRKDCSGASRHALDPRGGRGLLRTAGELFRDHVHGRELAGADDLADRHRARRIVQSAALADSFELCARRGGERPVSAGEHREADRSAGTSLAPLVPFQQRLGPISGGPRSVRRPCAAGPILRRASA